MTGVDQQTDFNTDELFTGAEKDFVGRALDVFRFQYAHNPLYRQFTDTLGVNPDAVRALEHIPFLPVSLFKTHTVRTGDFTPETVFESSGTTGMVTSRHEVKDLDLYRKSFTTAFQHFYGSPGE